MSNVSEKIEEMTANVLRHIDEKTAAIDSLAERVERIESLKDAPRSIKSAPIDEVAQKVFDSPEFQSLINKKSSQAGIEIPAATFINLQSKSILTDTIGTTERDMNIGGLPVRRRPWIHEQVTRSTTTGTTVEYARDNGDAVTAGVQYGGSPLRYDGADKTASGQGMELVEARTMTINCYTKVSRQALSDVDSLRTFIANRLGYAVRVKLDAEVIGSGTGAGNFKGITASGNFSPFTQPSPIYSLLDAVRVAAGELEAVDVDSTLVVLNPSDLAAIDISKASTSGDYLAANPRGDILRNLWGVPVTTSSAVSEGDFVIGDFLAGSTLWVRENVNLIVGTDGNDLTTNMLTCLVEMRAAFGVMRPAAFKALIA